ncbi:MAG: hypothetical protein JJE51_12765 [Thermoanaerobaculia bacterium]|nr:hypothetical protein [Thermoanaerobaculia bacterium]
MRARITAVGLLLIALTASGDEFRPRAGVSYETRDSNSISSSVLRKEIDLFLSRSLSSAVSIRVNLAARQFETGARFDGVRRPSTRSLELRPSTALKVVLGRFDSETEYLLRRASFNTSNADSVNTNESIDSRLQWTPSRYIPAGTLRATRYKVATSLSAGETTNDAVYGTLAYSWAALSATASSSRRIDSDSRARYDRTMSDHTGSLMYSDEFLGGKMSVNASASGALSNIDEQSDGASQIPAVVPFTRALWVVDETPLDSFDRPLSSVPALNDGRLNTSAGISLGPESTSFQTIAFDFGRLARVSLVEVVVRDERQDLVVNAGGIDWSVYTSSDGVRWIAHTSEVVSRFDAARSQFDISFESIDARWLKVVTFGVTSQAAFVTEVRTFLLTTVSRPSRETRYRTYGSSAALSYTPLRALAINYTGSLYSGTQDVGGVAGWTEVRDLNHTLGFQFSPRGPLGYDLRFETHSAGTDEYTEDSRGVSGGIRYVPRQQLQFLLSCDVREEEIDLELRERRTCSTQASARIFPSLDVTLGGSDGVQDRITEQGRVLTRSYYLNTSARLTRAFTLLLSGSSSHATIEGSVEQELPPSRDDRAYAEVDWRGNRVIGLGVSLGWVAGEAFEGLVQRYRVRWSPFGDGAITITTQYSQDIDPQSDGRSERMLIAPRWQVNGNTVLSLTYTSVITTGIQDFESKSILASLSIAR